MRRLIALLCVGFVVPLGHAQEGTKADIRGTITKLSPLAAAGKDTLGSMLVEGKKEKVTQVDKASVTITKATKIEVLVAGQKKPAAMKDLKAGMRVQVDFTGPVAESYPVQARAGSILILPTAKVGANP